MRFYSNNQSRITSLARQIKEVFRVATQLVVDWLTPLLKAYF